MSWSQIEDLPGSKISDALESEFGVSFMHLEIKGWRGKLHEGRRKQGGDWITECLIRVCAPLRAISRGVNLDAQDK